MKKRRKRKKSKRKRDSKGRYKNRTTNRKKSRRKKRRGISKARRAAAARKGWRKRKRTRNTGYKRRRNYSRRRRRKSARRRRRNPIYRSGSAITLDFKKLADILPAAISGAIGFSAAGIIDAISMGKLSEWIGGVFAGKDKAGKTKPLDYQAKARGRAALDMATFGALWFGTSKVDMLRPYRTPVLIGAAIRSVRSLMDAILDPKPDTISSGVRRVLALPAVQTKTLPPAANIAGKLRQVEWDRDKKAYVDGAGNKVAIKYLPSGVATDAASAVLIDAETQTVIQKDTAHGLGTVYEEWDLVMSGAEAGYEMNGDEMGVMYEDWDEVAALEGTDAGYEVAAYDDMYGDDLGTHYEDWEETMGGDTGFGDPLAATFEDTY